jgi:hypothetical protein
MIPKLAQTLLSVSSLSLELQPVGYASVRRVEEPKQAARPAVVRHEVELARITSCALHPPPGMRCIAPATRAPLYTAALYRSSPSPKLPRWSVP